MIIGKVLGNVWATKKDPKLGGHKLLVIRTVGGAEGAETIVAVDTIGAGRGEDVLVTKGSVARASLGDRDSPIDAVVVGIIDSLEVDQELLASPAFSNEPEQALAPSPAPDSPPPEIAASFDKTPSQKSGGDPAPGQPSSGNLQASKPAPEIASGNLQASKPPPETNDGKPDKTASKTAKPKKP